MPISLASVSFNIIDIFLISFCYISYNVRILHPEYSLQELENTNIKNSTCSTDEDAGCFTKVNNSSETINRCQQKIFVCRNGKVNLNTKESKNTNNNTFEMSKKNTNGTKKGVLNGELRNLANCKKEEQLDNRNERGSGYYMRYKKMSNVEEVAFFEMLRNVNNTWSERRGERRIDTKLNADNRSVTSVGTSKESLDSSWSYGSRFKKRKMCTNIRTNSVYNTTTCTDNLKPIEKISDIEPKNEKITNHNRNDQENNDHIKKTQNNVNDKRTDKNNDENKLNIDFAQIKECCDNYEMERSRVMKEMIDIKYIEIDDIRHENGNKVLRTNVSEIANTKPTCTVRPTEKIPNDHSYKLEVADVPYRPRLSTRRITNCYPIKARNDENAVIGYDVRKEGVIGYDLRKDSVFYKKDLERPKLAESNAVPKINKQNDETALATERLLKSLAAFKQEQMNSIPDTRDNEITQQLGTQPVCLEESMQEIQYDIPCSYMRICDILHPKVNINNALIEVKKSQIHGMGVYAKERLFKDQLIGEYVGEIIGKGLSDKRELQYKKKGIKDIYMFGMAEDIIIDATKFGSVLRFVNHSCDANSYAEIKRFRNEVYRVYFAADRCINPGEEITIDYQMKRDEDEERLECFCKSKNCRKYIDH